ncbi:TonB-dependent receptor [Sphingomonas sp. EC-HK361]|uniref:TonB-dependent receptor plug domain-containing protein n=1 Tax=Sphingomonas sp. EC-HK361 TaxID=2038397 RepID=UPI00125909B4|nr:TonB-dependent receptor [Sphingomonas sp. EC-HK361]VVT02104.1 TonB-dependent receptor [Sphingomonas sp. EC-HK361]
MKNSLTKAALRCATSLSMAGVVLVASPAFAQQTLGTSGTDAPTTSQTQDGLPASETTAADGSSNAAGEIVVTGSRIRRSNFNSTEPLTVITRSEMTQAGFSSATDALQSNAITQGASQINNYYGGFVTDGGTGANTVSLRGLGPTRTLVLLNGHRLAPAGTRGSVGSVDTNVLPSALIERIEVLKAGASSIYGSDAVAGVVNIITDSKLDGLVLDAQVNFPEIGAGSSERLSASYGTHGDRWRVIGSAEYYKRSIVTTGDVPFARCPIAGYLTGEGTAFGSGDYIDPATGKPACFTLDNGGVTINTLGVPTRTATPAPGETGTLFNRLRPNAAITTGATPGYEGVGYYTRDTFDPRTLQDPLVTPVQTYTGYLQAGYDTGVLGNAELYVELLGNRRESTSPGYRQLTLDYATGSPLVPTIFRNGVFLPAGGSELTNGQATAVRSFIGYGQLNSAQRVDFYRTAVGLRGDINVGDWRYDLYGSRSWTDARYSSDTFLTSRLAQSLNVVQNADGSFACVDASNNCVAAPAVNAASIGGNLSDAYRNFITDTVTGTTKFREYIASLNVDGSLFSLPGGKVKASLGAEYRHSSINDQPPPESVAGDLYNLTSAAPTVGSDEVWEAYGELYMPLLANVPLAYSLNLDASGRYTHYRSYGGGWTYKVSADYQPFRGFGLRANYGTSYRAPALFEQFLGATSGFLGSNTDPCDDYGNSQNPIIQRNCAALGLPADFVQTNGVTVLSGGGASGGLKAETSKNFSAGVVLTPVLGKAFGDLSVSLDYFAITVNNEVSRAGAAGILSLCYAAANFNPNGGYCNFVDRDPTTNALTVFDNYVNLSTEKRKGFEVNLRYAHDVGAGNIRFNALVTKYTEQSLQRFPTDALIDANGTITTPDWSGTFEAFFNFGGASLRYGLDWINGDRDRTYRYLAKDTTTGEIDPSYEQFLRDNYYLEVPSYFLHSASIQFDVQKKFQMTVGVRNMLDKHPPRITAGAYSLIGNAPLYSGYDYVGRTFFVNTTAKF